MSLSRGVFKVDNKEALDYALEWSKKKEVILEEFVESLEYSGESVAYEGKYILLTVTEKANKKERMLSVFRQSLLQIVM